MIDTFLRPPRGFAEWFADGVRAIGLLSIITVAVGWGLVEVAVMALVLLGLCVPRLLGVRPALDIVFSVALLVAAWSSVLDLYAKVPDWDVVVHFATNGVIAAVAYILFVRAGIAPGHLDSGVPVISVIVLTTAFGLSGGVLWEIAEWAGHTFIDRSIYVEYNDTIGDLAAGGMGSILAGGLMRFLAADNRAVA
ncbi:MAG: hypothetical protein JWQ43_4012 [Glaciihabitans sp.]|nr:hypothetical protein [Glaciihabitans sp.]